MDSQDSPWPEVRGSHHLLPYSIIYDSSQGLYPNGVFFRDSKIGSLEIPEIGTSTTLDAHDFLCRP